MSPTHRSRWSTALAPALALALTVAWPARLGATLGARAREAHRGAYLVLPQDRAVAEFRRVAVPRVQLCHARVLRLHPEVGVGRMVLHVRVALSGALEDLAITARTFDPPGLADCILERLGATRLSPRRPDEGPVEFSLSMAFAPGR